jgi:transposase
MRKLKEVLRLHSLGLKQQQIARSCSIAQSTVHGYLKAATVAGVSWPLPPDWDEQRLQEALSGRARAVATRRKNHAPDFAALRLQLQSHRNLTLQLLWEEYRQDTPEGYSYSRFCELYHEWGRKLDVVLRHEHRAGEKMFVDYAGTKIPVYDQRTGEVACEASLFVADAESDRGALVEPVWSEFHSHGGGRID